MHQVTLKHWAIVHRHPALTSAQGCGVQSAANPDPKLDLLLLTRQMKLPGDVRTTAAVHWGVLPSRTLHRLPENPSFQGVKLTRIRGILGEIYSTFSNPVQVYLKFTNICTICTIFPYLHHKEIASKKNTQNL